MYSTGKSAFDSVLKSMKPASNNTIVDGAKKNYFEQFPEEQAIQQVLPDSFIINRPMSGVGGDGYWFHEADGCIYLVAFDCMGHGHLASMMTRIYTNALKKVVVGNELNFPNYILHLMHQEIKAKFQNNDKKLLGTGADFGIIKINTHIGELEFAGAKMNLVEVADGELNIIKSDRLQIGEMFDYEHNYKTEIIDLKKRETSSFYLFSDGVTDLVGGPNNKKLSLRELKRLVVENQHLSMQEQRAFFENFMDVWSGSQKPLDDALLIGFKWNS